MMTEDTDPLVGDHDLWMTGYVDGVCSIVPSDGGGGGLICAAGVGKVSYLGGHRYDTDVRNGISSHPDSQGTRLFLNSLFEAACVVEETQPDVQIVKTAPDLVTEPRSRSPSTTRTGVSASRGPSPFPTSSRRGPPSFPQRAVASSPPAR